MSILDRFKGAWNLFKNKEPPLPYHEYVGGTYTNPARIRAFNHFGPDDKSLVQSVYNQIAVDCAKNDIFHVRLNDEGKFKEVIDDPLNTVLSKEANIDQTGRKLIQDIVESMLEEGVVAVVPYNYSTSPYDSDSFNIYEARVAKITQWYPKHIRVDIYDDRSGIHRQIKVQKRMCAIIENPFYSTMNRPNSTARRLSQTLAKVEKLNSDTASGKLDLIVQLPYAVQTTAKERIAESRRRSIEDQLKETKYGIAYIDSTERITQLNRPLENNLWAQAKDLRAELYNQLGFSDAVFDGTADEKTMLNYNNRTIEPILTAIVEEMERKWLSKTARSQKQAIRFFSSPFKLVPVNQLAEIVDKFTRNEIMSSNEFRAILGLKPSDDPKADQLVNSNLNQPEEKIEEKPGLEEGETNNENPFP